MPFLSCQSAYLSGAEIVMNGASASGSLSDLGPLLAG